ncbi:MAG: hypothetical protein ACREJG_06115, partial [Candidatus Rokuibacteriota bacterium]
MSEKFRTLTGAPGVAERLLLVALTLVGVAWSLELHHTLAWAFFKEQYLGVFLALALCATFLGVKPHPGAPAARVPWHDWLLAVAGLVVGLY